MTDIEHLFFQLLAVAVGNRVCLLRKPTDEEWQQLFEMSKKQTLRGVAFAGVERLPEEQWPPRKLRLIWGGVVQKTIDRNKELNQRCRDVASAFRRNGFWCCILKGQGNLVNYPEWLKDKRTSGDIDVWVLPESDDNGEVKTPIRRVVEYCTSIRPALYVYYHHLDFPVLKGVPIEVHYRATWLFCPWRNYILQRWFKTQLRKGIVNASFTDYPIPTAEFNAVFQLLHIYKHLFEEGIGLRQLLDYYFVLKNVCEESKPEINKLLKSINCAKFAGALMWVLREVFDSSADEKSWMLCKPNENEGRFLLDEILKAGNFGKYDDRLTFYNNNAGLKPKFMYGYEKLKRNLRFVFAYPEEVLCEPFFRIYHFAWRTLKLWKWE